MKFKSIVINFIFLFTIFYAGISSCAFTSCFSEQDNFVASQKPKTMTSSDFNAISEEDPNTLGLTLIRSNPSLSQLKYFPNLTSLDLKDATFPKRVTLNLKPIFWREHLQFLDLSGQTSINDTCLEGITALKRLKELSLSSTMIMGECLSQIANRLALVSLDISNTHVSDRDLQPFLSNQSLKEINLSSTFISEKFIFELENKNIKVIQ